MNFNSFSFAFFFIVIYGLYLLLNHRWQNRMLLIASYVFYSFWDWRFLGLILISTLSDFVCAMKIDENTDRSIRKRFLMVSLCVNLSILFFFKYFNFFVENFVTLFSLFGMNIQSPAWKVILPVGISFYTFQTLSYTIDVYRKQVKPTRSFPDYALYVSFFPQLVAGPIERAKNLLPQILNRRSIRGEDVFEGLLLIYWGLFKKIFIAENMGTMLAFMDNPVSADRMTGDGGIILVSMYVFMFQLYCDFSAYSDIARGTAKMMGFDIMINFRAPFFAPNIQETWNRWHISLTTWIRDYLYYPLALMKVGKKHIDVRLLVIITFLIMGLWHGAAWNFIFWGGYHGLLLAGYASIAPRLEKYHPESETAAKVLHVLSVMLTFNAAAFGLIFFRANSAEQICMWIYHLFASFAVTPAAIEMFTQMMFYASPLLLVDMFLYKNDSISRFFRCPAVAKYGFIYLAFCLMVLFGKRSVIFIYFQF